MFFFLVGVVWKILNREIHERSERAEEISTPHSSLVTRHWTAGIAIVAFAYLVFSYFYIWTAAAAFLGCVGVTWLVVRPEDVWRDIRLLALVGVGCLVSLVPYFYLLSKRSSSIDEVQMLVRTHSPDLFRVPELMSFCVLLFVGIAIWKKVLSLKDAATLFAIALAVTTIVVFNQQVVTGRSLQPIHYEVFIGNYISALALLIVAGLVWKRSAFSKTTAARLVLAATAVASCGWGLVECYYTGRVLDDANIAVDESIPVARRLAEIAKDDPHAIKRNVLYFGIPEADNLSTYAPQSVLWARHQHVFAGVTWQEHKKRYYQLLIYQGTTPEQLASVIKSGKDIVPIFALWGWGRHTNRLSSEYTALRFTDVDAEVEKYAAYRDAFDARAQDVPRLDFLILRADADGYFEQLDKWYERSGREVWGKYVIYRLQLR